MNADLKNAGQNQPVESLNQPNPDRFRDRNNFVENSGRINSDESANPDAVTSPETEPAEKEYNPDWAHDALQELEDWIESQGIYIRQ